MITAGKHTRGAASACDDDGARPSTEPGSDDDRTAPASAAATRRDVLGKRWCALVWHTHDVDPTWLGQQLRAAPLRLGGDLPRIVRERVARSIGLGGPLRSSRERPARRRLDVLNENAHADAGFAATQRQKNGLAFYIANAESLVSGDAGYVAAVRQPTSAQLEPTMTAGLSSLCDANGIGLQPWATAGFAFLPQAYVNDFGLASHRPRA